MVERAITRWEWAELVMGPKGPGDHRLRLTAMALFMHMNDQAQCWVGQLRIAERTGFGERSVRRHVESLERDGWIQRSLVKDAGKSWRKTVYTASLPEAAANGVPEQTDSQSSAATNGVPHLSEAAANGVPDHRPPTMPGRLNGAANAGQGPAKSSEGAANSLAGAANGWPMNRDLNRDMEPISRTSGDHVEKNSALPSKSLRGEQRRLRNRSFEEINTAVEKLFVEDSLLPTPRIQINDIAGVARSLGLSDDQAKQAIGQLIDRRRLPVLKRSAAS